MAKAITKIETGSRMDPLSILAEETRERMKADFHQALGEHGSFAWVRDGDYIRTCLRGIHQGLIQADLEEQVLKGRQRFRQLGFLPCDHTGD